MFEDFEANPRDHVYLERRQGVLSWALPTTYAVKKCAILENSDTPAVREIKHKVGSFQGGPPRHGPAGLGDLKLLVKNL